MRQIDATVSALLGFDSQPFKLPRPMTEAERELYSRVAVLVEAGSTQYYHVEEEEVEALGNKPVPQLWFKVLKNRVDGFPSLDAERVKD